MQHVQQTQQKVDCNTLHKKGIKYSHNPQNLGGKNIKLCHSQHQLAIELLHSELSQHLTPPAVFVPAFA